MATFIRNFDTMISLGYNCFPKRFINLYTKSETNFFDYLGTPMWAICELLENNFDNFLNNFLDETNFIKTQIFENGDQIIVNKKYYVRILHDLHDYHDFHNTYDMYKSHTVKFNRNKNIFNQFIDKYKRRYIRFINILNDHVLNKKKILFIRLEEPMENRKLCDEYKKKYEENEIFYLKHFCKIISTRHPDLYFRILFISKTMDNHIVDKNIIVLKNIKIDNWTTCNTSINELILSENNYLNDWVK